MKQRTVVTTREFAASREKVFDAWTQAAQLAQWWGPDGFTVPECIVAAREGGAWRLCLRSPRGEDHRVNGVFRSFKEPESLDLSLDVEVAPGTRRLTGFVTMKVAVHNSRTRMTVHVGAAAADEPAEAELQGLEEAWKQTLDRLGSFLAKG